MAKVYVVTYDDPHDLEEGYFTTVEAAFSTKELAEQYIAKELGPKSWYEIHKLEVDEKA